MAVGTASLSFDYADEPGRTEDLVDAALTAGLRVFDTALAYSTATVEGHAEVALARALDAHPLGKEATVITKGGHYRVGNTFPIDGRPSTLRRHVEASLTHVGRDHLDVYLLHHPDPEVPIEVSVAALDGFRAEGLIGTIGVSNVDVELYRRARGTAQIGVVQNPRSVYEHGDEDVLKACEADRVAFLAYSPLAGADRASRTVTDAVATVATRHRVSAPEVALAWLLATSPIVIPVSGASRPETVRSAAAATQITLDDTDVALIQDAVSR